MPVFSAGPLQLPGGLSSCRASAHTGSTARLPGSGRWLQVSWSGPLRQSSGPMVLSLPRDEMMATQGPFIRDEHFTEESYQGPAGRLLVSPWLHGSIPKCQWPQRNFCLNRGQPGWYHLTNWILNKHLILRGIISSSWSFFGHRVIKAWGQSFRRGSELCARECGLLQTPSLSPDPPRNMLVLPVAFWATGQHADVPHLSWAGQLSELPWSRVP